MCCSYMERGSFAVCAWPIQGNQLGGLPVVKGSARTAPNPRNIAFLGIEQFENNIKSDFSHTHNNGSCRQS